MFVRPVRIGTRGSLLALAQARITQRALERLGVATDIVIIATKGDKDRRWPLSAVKDRTFFNAELDAALFSGEVDITAHSLKDLPVERPFAQVFPEREDPRDVVLFRPGIFRILTLGGTLRLGTSSERRSRNVAAFLGEALPRRGAEVHIELADMRGNVEERVSQLQGGRFDGVVLALAGLNRLWKDDDGRRALAPLLEDLRWMVLPLEDCPTAPGQGVIVIEHRKNDGHIRDLLAAIHEPELEASLTLERRLMVALPLESRALTGITAIGHPELGALAWIRGPGAARVHWSAPPKPTAARAWEGTRWRASARTEPVAFDPQLVGVPALFVAHERALSEDLLPPGDTRIWAAGPDTWRALAKRGVWVEGCAERLGFDTLRSTLAADVLRLPPLSEWRVLTHEGAVASWREAGVGDVVPTYRIVAERHNAPVAELSSSTHFYWSSAAQHDALRAVLPANAQHACGPGKTLHHLRQAGVANLTAFPSVTEWRAWLA